ncbi:MULTISPECIES: hypothetical protein [unclassified Leifsonia]|uniref:hypothetical protein n=1 Tax=unclassified Leifsonia TaxID=2663824 RepID=UPI0006F63B39|nr:MULTISPECIES: hypothetical protein [unclassified Leifsonia]KQX06735.1 hypothetical protein ASC59_02540 [Leifsonia sp. Root1293]KRA11019.1 hypothetical protein ASD61_02540 [Leifsonia sp. Root60]
MTDAASPTSAEPPPVPPGVRAQILATEHWGLLASRSTSQAEVLTRIAIFLTLVSAALVSVSLLGQATKYSGPFAPSALGILGLLYVIGILTQVRVINVADEDMMFVIAMNRLRAAYVDIDPGVERYFFASAHDDEVGMQRTYSFLRPRGSTQVAGSSMVFIIVVNSAVLGMFVGGLIAALTGLYGLAIVVGAVLVVLSVVVWLMLGYRGYRRSLASYTPISPSAPES